MSRTRLIRPEFFSDPTMGKASDSTKLVYIGLWTLCDDAGYFEDEPERMAAELFRWESVTRREKRVRLALAELGTLGRIRYLDCGEHGIIPTLPDYRMKGGQQAFGVKKRHEDRCLRRTTSDIVPVSVSVSDSVSLSAQARKERETAARMEAYRRQGLPVDTVA